MWAGGGELMGLMACGLMKELGVLRGASGRKWLCGEPSRGNGPAPSWHRLMSRWKILTTTKASHATKEGTRWQERRDFSCTVTGKRDKPHAQTIRKERICHVCDAVGTRIHLGKEPALPPRELCGFSL